MKKILPLLLAVMLVVCMAVPSFADGLTLPSWVTEKFNYQIYPSDFDMSNPFILAEAYGHFYAFQGLDSQPIIMQADNKNSTERVKTWRAVFGDDGKVASWESLGTQMYFGTQGNDHVYSTHHIYNVDGDIVILGDAFYSTSCDGSACPATDMDANGVCDDCGRPLSLRRTGYPELPVVNGSNLHSVVLEREDGYFYIVLTSDTPYTIGGSVEDKYLITVANEQEVSYVTYKCTDGQNWVQQNAGKAYATTVGSSSSTLLASTFDWYKDGTLFFQVPLWEKVDQVTQGQMMGLTTETVGTMRILALCGVGCLALLVVLKLFGKRSLIYRN